MTARGARFALALLVLTSLPATPQGGNLYEGHGTNGSVRKPFISRTMEFCYERLVKDSWCCLDHDIGPRVSRTSVRRAGTAWVCDRESGCRDADYGGRGERGVDVLWTPAGADCESPRVLYIHGGSWMYGSPTNNGYDSLASKLAESTGAVALVIDYPLVPIGNYTAIAHAALEALDWLADHGPAGDSCVDGPRPALVVGGDSSGGGTAVSVMLQAQLDEGRWPDIAGAFLFSPWTNLLCDTPTYYYNAFGKRTNGLQSSAYTGDVIFHAAPEQNAHLYRNVAKAYVAGDERLLVDPVASPFFAEAELRGSPPMFVVVSGTEAITGDSVVLASKAAQQGVDVHLDVYPGMWHVFPMYSKGCGSQHALWQATLALNRTGQFVRAVAEGVRGSATVSFAAGRGTPETVVHYGEPLEHGSPWIPVLPLALRRSATAEPPEPAVQMTPEPAPPVIPNGADRGQRGPGALVAVFAAGGLLGLVAGPAARFLGRRAASGCAPCCGRWWEERQALKARSVTDLECRTGTPGARNEASSIGSAYF